MDNISSKIFNPPPLISSSPDNQCSSQNKLHQKPKNKHSATTKFLKIDTSHEGSSILSKPKTTRKPDPSAPKILRPCTECGKRFWSWKAFFGHMRYHPERKWRGINPPPSFYHSDQDEEEDHELANCLLMLANNGPFNNNNNLSDDQPRSVTTVHQEVQDPYSDPDQPKIVGDHGVGPSGLIKLFECSSCKRVFGSRQALGGIELATRISRAGK